jgi:hypothetical protein
MIYLMNNNHVNLKTFEAFVTTLKEAYRYPNPITTAQWALSKLHQGNWYFIVYYVKC